MGVYVFHSVNALSFKGPSKLSASVFLVGVVVVVIRIMQSRAMETSICRVTGTRALPRWCRKWCSAHRTCPCLQLDWHRVRTRHCDRIMVEGRKGMGGGVEGLRVGEGSDRTAVPCVADKYAPAPQSGVMYKSIRCCVRARAPPVKTFTHLLYMKLVGRTEFESKTRAATAAATAAKTTRRCAMRRRR